MEKAESNWAESKGCPTTPFGPGGVGAGIVPIDPQSLNSFAYLFTWNKLHKFIRSGFGPFVKVSFHISFHAYVSMALIPFFSAKVE
ncbi:hypothetical protein [Hydrogenispora ethanolica]|uniref:hypothetical protein n=1 Tax=Hydrogenispora ethanolica TaxID=1082276 RepID=UPI0010525E36|nr:hypothetical protein [Hydrogenispora ethanolica]